MRCRFSKKKLSRYSKVWTQCRTHKAGNLIQKNKKFFTQLQANVVQRHETTDSKQWSNNYPGVQGQNRADARVDTQTNPSSSGGRSGGCLDQQSGSGDWPGSCLDSRSRSEGQSGPWQRGRSRGGRGHGPDPAGDRQRGCRQGTAANITFSCGPWQAAGTTTGSWSTGMEFGNWTARLDCCVGW